MKKKKRTKSPDLTGYVLINGGAAYLCRTKSRRTSLIQELRAEGKLKENFELRTIK